MSDVNLSENMSKLLKILSGGILNFFNGSFIQEAPIGGLRQVCSIDYKKDWSLGSNYYRGQGSEDIRLTDLQPSDPTETHDISQGYIVGSFYKTVDQRVFICTDNTAFGAIWLLVGGLDIVTSPSGSKLKVSDTDIWFYTNEGWARFVVSVNPPNNNDDNSKAIVSTPATVWYDLSGERMYYCADNTYEAAQWITTPTATEAYSFAVDASLLASTANYQADTAYYQAGIASAAASDAASIATGAMNAATVVTVDVDMVSAIGYDPNPGNYVLNVITAMGSTFYLNTTTNGWDSSPDGTSILIVSDGFLTVAVTSAMGIRDIRSTGTMIDMSTTYCIKLVKLNSYTLMLMNNQL